MENRIIPPSFSGEESFKEAEKKFQEWKNSEEGQKLIKESKAKLITPLEQARRAAGLTRKDLANLSGVNLRTIEAYEQRKANFNLCAAEKVRKLAKALYRSMEDLLDPEE